MDDISKTAELRGLAKLAKPSSSATVDEKMGFRRGRVGGWRPEMRHVERCEGPEVWRPVEQDGEFGW
jgi:hypothetical protein